MTADHTCPADKKSMRTATEKQKKTREGLNWDPGVALSQYAPEIQDKK
jgi:hypothetical protein